MERAVTLAAARLADDPEGLAGIDGRGNAVDRPHHPAGGEEMGLQMVDFEERRARLSAGRSGYRFGLFQEYPRHEPSEHGMLGPAKRETEETSWLIRAWGGAAASS